MRLGRRPQSDSMAIRLALGAGSARRRFGSVRLAAGAESDFDSIRLAIRFDVGSMLVRAGRPPPPPIFSATSLPHHPSSPRHPSSTPQRLKERGRVAAGMKRPACSSPAASVPAEPPRRRAGVRAAGRRGDSAQGALAAAAAPGPEGEAGSLALAERSRRQEEPQREAPSEAASARTKFNVKRIRGLWREDEDEVEEDSLESGGSSEEGEWEEGRVEPKFDHGFGALCEERAESEARHSDGLAPTTPDEAELGSTSLGSQQGATHVVELLPGWLSNPAALRCRRVEAVAYAAGAAAEVARDECLRCVPPETASHASGTLQHLQPLAVGLVGAGSGQKNALPLAWPDNSPAPPSGSGQEQSNPFDDLD